jgi:hypothetical protein
MAKVPKDIQEGITKLSEVANVPVESLMKRLKEIIQTDETIQSMENEDFKIRYAWTILYREFSLSGKTEEFKLTPLSKPRSREAKVKGDLTWVGDMAALVKKVSKDENGKIIEGDWKYAAGTFWRDGAKNIEKLVVGKLYQTQLIATENAWGLSITSDRAGFIELKEKVPSIEEFYNTEIKPKNLSISIGEMDLNKSEYNTNIKVFEATVIDAVIGEKDGREYGRYLVMDNSTIGSNFAVFVSPDDVVWEQGSILIFGGTISIDDKSGQIRWNNHFIMPTELSMKREMIVKKTAPEEVDLGDIEAAEIVGNEKIDEPTVKEVKPVKKKESVDELFEV